MGKPSGFCAAGQYRREFPDGTFRGCGRWLTQRDFELHGVQREGVDGHRLRCLSDEELLALGWRDEGDGSWSSPRRIADMARLAAKKARIAP